MKLSKDPGRPKAVHLFMFMFYWCEQRELCPGKVNQSFFRLALTLRGVGFSHPFILTFYSCRFLSLLCFTFPPPFSPSCISSFFRSCFHSLFVSRSSFLLKTGSPGSFFCSFLSCTQNISGGRRTRWRLEKSKQTKAHHGQVLFSHAKIFNSFHGSEGVTAIMSLWYTGSAQCDSLIHTHTHMDLHTPLARAFMHAAYACSDTDCWIKWNL